MKNRKSFVKFFILGLLVLLLMVPAGTAFAESGGGEGWLKAEGSGLAGVAGNGSIEVAGNGVLWVRDSGGDAVIHVRGYGSATKFPGGWTLYTGFNGAGRISGSDVEVMVMGVRIRLKAEGVGQFYLRGQGTYETGSGSGEWSDTLQTFELAE